MYNIITGLFSQIQKGSIQVDERYSNGDAQEECQHESHHQKRQIDHRRVHFRVVEWRPREADVKYFDEIEVNDIGDVAQST